MVSLTLLISTWRRKPWSGSVFTANLKKKTVVNSILMATYAILD